MPPSIWLMTPSGLTIWPASTAATTRLTLTRPVLRIDLDVGRDGAVAGEVLVLGEREAAPARAVAAAARLPAGAPRGRLDHGARARILHVPQSELDRIDARRRRQLVDERLEREDVGVSAERPQRRGAQGRLRDVVLDDLHVGHVVQGIALRAGAAGGLRDVGREDRRERLSQMPGREAG